ncbi:MAG: hypothetical protein GJ676_09660 [Rhodobacteraceae bacterium]|nr:hypothetical protein [Paracoccaceae bacterium]
MPRYVFLISLGYVVLFVVAWVSTATASMDAAGRGMALGFLTVAIGITVIFVIPALILALRDKAPNWALGLALAPAALMLWATVSGFL